MTQRILRIQKLQGMAEETEYTTDLTPEELSDEQILDFVDENRDQFQWEETEVITHFEIVDTIQ